MEKGIYELGNYKIEFRADGFFNATSFLEQWNATSKVKKRLDMFMRTSEALDAIVECKISKEEPVDKVREPFVKGRPKETVWYNTKLLVPLAKWFDNSLGTKAVLAVGVILATNIINDYIAERTNKLKELVSKFGGDYGRVEKGINCIVDKESNNPCRRLLNVENLISRLVGEIEIGMIKDYDGLINRLGNMYKN